MARHNILHDNPMSLPNNGRTHDERWEAQLRRGCLELAILAAIWNEKLYGLEILKRIGESARLDIGEGTLYPILMRLKQEGLLQSAWVEADVGHPRKYYWLTKSGRQRVLDMVQTWDQFTASISGLLVSVRKRTRTKPGSSKPVASRAAAAARLKSATIRITHPELIKLMECSLPC
ncbi:MAG TPA: PadR family transcriptional regulator [Bryobacteraceae bacterium]|nr:PadR family transcriptional regulator [Bryobacteraceae bacterium]